MIEMKEMQRVKDRIISQMLRERLFLPFALELLNYKVVFTDKVPLNAPACVYLDNIWINPDSEPFKNDSFPAVCTLMMWHEVLHPMFFHDKRRKHRDPDLFNIAGDFVINLLIKAIYQEAKKKSNIAGFKCAVDTLPYSQILLSDKFENMIEEEVYEQLLRDKNYRKETTYADMQQMIDYLNGNTDKLDETKEKKKSDKPQVKIVKTTFEFDGRKSVSKQIHWPPAPARTNKEKENQSKKDTRLKMARQMMKAELTKGDISEELRMMIGKLFHIKIDWEKILADSIMTALQKSPEMTWGMPRMSWLANPQLPYLPSCDIEETYGTVAFLLDESGSMTNEDLKIAFGIIAKSKDHYKNVLVIRHDTEASIDGIYEEFTDKDIERLCQRKHCGGTSHRHAFQLLGEWIKQHPDDRISVVIGCTDLCSDLEHCQNEFPTDIPRVWLVNSSWSVNGLIGRVIRLK